jgi:hypothetical protein
VGAGGGIDASAKARRELMRRAFWTVAEAIAKMESAQIENCKMPLDNHDLASGQPSLDDWSVG